MKHFFYWFRGKGAVLIENNDMGSGATIPSKNHYANRLSCNRLCDECANSFVYRHTKTKYHIVPSSPYISRGFLSIAITTICPKYIQHYTFHLSQFIQSIAWTMFLRIPFHWRMAFMWAFQICGLLINPDEGRHPELVRMLPPGTLPSPFHSRLTPGTVLWPRTNTHTPSILI